MKKWIWIGVVAVVVIFTQLKPDEVISVPT